jgi:hypothetical protein
MFNNGFYALASKARDEVLALAVKLGGFDVILVDFPWKFKTHSQKGMGRSAERHYCTMTLNEIMTYPITAFAARDCVLLSWTTAPFLALALDAMGQQGSPTRAARLGTKKSPRWDSGSAADTSTSYSAPAAIRARRCPPIARRP